MSTPFFEKLLSGREYSPLIVVESTLEQSNFLLLKEFVIRAGLSNRRVIWLTTENSVASLEKDLPGELRIVYVDAYTNVYAKKNDNSRQSPSLYVLKNASDLKEAEVLLKKLTQSTNVPYTLVLDSVSSFIRDSPVKTFKFIKNIVDETKEPSNVIATYHADVPDPTGSSGYSALPHISSAFSQLASTRVVVKNVLEQDPLDFEGPQEYITESSNSLATGKCEIEHKRKSGKVVRERIIFEVTPTGGLSISTIVDKPVIPEPESETPEVDPMANLSFNLNLTEEQRKAKNEVVLPYLKTQENEVSGAIYYEPDEADDFDDEDPDEDLNI
ncbi:hypothetical protein K493DRAFT_406551 [Basidiobolus meristosporus CBS 931.73]|uniref:Elongator complex protein 5 n=1 Tax=Basidiobolus meristosporus CBS 931.73 TaxID=1314790 RepID=A0A1Y1YKR4_9FUNG|nr:hypothetical protein K493DRAFT_406551 [Basidiobolus meristosporus CBS 931.73]|eukprot:ORX98588.1 hypothetical protein K493DRAFT_406551 [Basidiobolus meristosporus CBS 931.73]